MVESSAKWCSPRSRVGCPWCNKIIIMKLIYQLIKLPILFTIYQTNLTYLIILQIKRIYMEKYSQFISKLQTVFALPLPRTLRALLDYSEYLILKKNKNFKNFYLETKRQQKEFLSQELVDTLKWMSNEERIKYYMKISDFILGLSEGKSPSCMKNRYFQIEASIKTSSQKQWKKRTIKVNEQGQCLHIINKQKNSYQLCNLGFYLYRTSNEGIVLKSVDKRVAERLKTIKVEVEREIVEKIVNSIEYLQWKQIESILLCDPLSKGILNSVKVRSSIIKGENKENEGILEKQINMKKQYSFENQEVAERIVENEKEKDEWKLLEKKNQYEIYSEIKLPSKLKLKIINYEFDGNLQELQQLYRQFPGFSLLSQQQNSQSIKLTNEYGSKFIRTRVFTFRRSIIQTTENQTRIQENSFNPSFSTEQNNKIDGELFSLWVFKTNLSSEKLFSIEGVVEMKNKGYLTQQQNKKLNKEFLMNIANHFLEKQVSIKAKHKKKVIDEVIWTSEWKRDEKEGGLVYLNEQKIANQKKILGHVLSSLAKNILSRKSILQVSLPVHIFSQQTNLQRLLYSLRYAPSIFKQNMSGVEKLVSSFSFCISMSLLYLDQEKVFNPILGETSQISIDGCNAYGQQISHHPPISAILFYGKGYKIYGQLQSKADLYINSGTGCNYGPLTVEFDDGTKIVNWLASGQVEGLSYGKRKFKLTDKSIHYNKKENLYLEVSYNKGNRGGYFGFGKKSVSDVFETKVYKLNASSVNDLEKNKNKKITQEDIVETVGEVKGIWNEEIFYNEKSILNFHSSKPSYYEADPKALPSDSQWRKDLFFRKQRKFNEAQKQKERLEQIQRMDKKLRK